MTLRPDGKPMRALRVLNAVQRDEIIATTDSAPFDALVQQNFADYRFIFGVATYSITDAGRAVLAADDKGETE